MDATTLSVSANGRRYALRELARRAGVEKEFLDQWRVDAGERETVVELPLPERPRIVFEHAPQEHFTAFLRQGTERHRVARARWPGERPRGSKNTDFLLPFSPPDAPDGVPLFAIEGRSARARLDVLASTLLLLSRAEELLPGIRDSWDRFPAERSVLGRAGSLERPVVDEYGAAFRRALGELLPTWSPREIRPRLHLSHDLDDVGVPFRLRQTAGHALRRGSLRAALRDVVASVSSLAPAFLDALCKLVGESERLGLRSAVYLKASERTAFDSGYALSHPKVRRVVQQLRDRGVELGVHPSHYTLGQPARLRREVQALRSVLGGGALGGRQHHLRWSPVSWLDWERAGLAYDASVGFADRPGFRAGTCVPYRPFLLWLDRPARLVEIPLVVMDTTLIRYQGLGAGDVRSAALRLLETCRSVAGGVFTLLWHNTHFIHPGHAAAYRDVLAELVSFEQFDPNTVWS